MSRNYETQSCHLNGLNTFLRIRRVVEQGLRRLFLSCFACSPFTNNFDEVKYTMHFNLTSSICAALEAILKLSKFFRLITLTFFQLKWLERQILYHINEDNNVRAKLLASHQV